MSVPLLTQAYPHRRILSHQSQRMGGGSPFLYLTQAQEPEYGEDAPGAQ